MPKPDVYLTVGTPPKTQHGSLPITSGTGKGAIHHSSAWLYLWSSQERVPGGILHHRCSGWAMERFQRLTLRAAGRGQHPWTAADSDPSAADVTHGASRSPPVPQPSQSLSQLLGTDLCRNERYASPIAAQPAKQSESAQAVGNPPHRSARALLSELCFRWASAGKRNPNRATMSRTSFWSTQCSQEWK